LLKVVWHLRHMRGGRILLHILPHPLLLRFMFHKFGIVVKFFVYIREYAFTVIDLGDLGIYIYIN
jgi:hypothetical protein